MHEPRPEREDAAKSWALVLSTFVVLFSGAGLIHQFGLLQEFDVGLSDYADIDDFLVAAVNLLAFRGKYWFALVFLILLIALIGVGGRLAERKWRHRSSTDEAARSIIVRTMSVQIWRLVLCSILTVLGIWPVSYYAGKAAAADVKAGNACRVDVQLRNPPSAVATSTQHAELFLVTGLNSAVVLYEKPSDPKTAGTVHVVPAINFGLVRYLECP